MVSSKPTSRNLDLEAVGGSDVSVDRIRGAIGSLLMVWSDIERAARQEIVRAGSPVQKPGVFFADILNRWMWIVAGEQEQASLRAAAAHVLRAELERHRKMRNGICHCLTGYSTGHGTTPATLTWTANGEDCSVTYQELRTALDWLAGVPRAMAVITNSPTAGPQSRVTDNPENRAWWLEEFGIDLSTQN